MLAIIFFFWWVEPSDIFYFYIILQGSPPLHGGRQLILNGVCLPRVMVFILDFDNEERLLDGRKSRRYTYFY